MTSKRLPVLKVFVAVCLLGASLQAGATAIANSALDFRNLAITPAAGTFALDGPWFLQAFAHADNSLGESADQLSPNLPPDFLATSPATVSASAAVTWASAQGAAGAPNVPPDLVVTGSAQSSVNVPGCGPAAAFSKGHGTLFNFFTLSGGGPSVNVQFAIDIAGTLNLLTDICGAFARTETVFTLEVDGQVVLFDDRLREIGHSDALTEQFAQHLTATVTLDAIDSNGDPLSHFLLLEADSESSGFVAIPEPPAGLLLVAGLVAFAAARRRPVLVRLGK
jgi:hypothetical protein